MKRRTALALGGVAVGVPAAIVGAGALETYALLGGKPVSAPEVEQFARIKLPPSARNLRTNYLDGFLDDLLLVRFTMAAKAEATFAAQSRLARPGPDSDGHVYAHTLARYGGAQTWWDLKPHDNIAGYAGYVEWAGASGSKTVFIEAAIRPERNGTATVFIAAFTT